MSDNEQNVPDAPPEAPSTPPPAPAEATAGPTGPFRPQRSPGLAGFFSAVVPGFGNVYNGLFSRGLYNFLIFVAIFFTAVQSRGGPELALLMPAMLFTWLFGIVDAYRNATLINHGVTDLELQEKLPEIKAGGGVAVGVTLFLVGFYGLLTQVFDFDLSVLFDYWYLILMGLGGWLVWNGIRQRNESTETAWSSTD